MKDDKDSKKIPLSIKEIGLPKILIMVLAGIIILICSVPEFLGSDNNSSTKRTSIQTQGKKTAATTVSDSLNTYVENMENRLEVALRQVSGIGKVDVMITLKSSKEQVALKDSTNQQNSSNETDSQGGSRTQTDISKSEETVMSQENQGASTPYIVKEMEPEVEGVLVIAQGGGNAEVVSEINSIVQVLFNVPAHKIIVTKMI